MPRPGRRIGSPQDGRRPRGVSEEGAPQRRLTAAIAGLGGLLFGYDTGVIAGALLFIKSDFDLGSFAQGLVVAAVPIGAVGGAALAGPAADRYGRRLMILIAAAVFIVGALASAAAPGVEVLVLARIVIGVAIGLGCVPALALAIGMLRMPQSPRWLVMTGDDFAARATLAKIRVDDPDTIDRELEEIKDSLDEKPGAWSELLQPVVRAALTVGVGLAICNRSRASTRSSTTRRRSSNSPA